MCIRDSFQSACESAPYSLNRMAHLLDRSAVVNYVISNGRPVSYTHLDVYKRQILTAAPNSDSQQFSMKARP